MGGSESREEEDGGKYSFYPASMYLDDVEQVMNTFTKRLENNKK